MGWRLYRRSLIDENKYRAARWGLDGKISDFGKKAEVPTEALLVEIRLMFLKPDDERSPVLTQNLCRLSRGKMLGVAFNKSFTWVGSSVGLWPLANPDPLKNR